MGLQGKIMAIDGDPNRLGFVSDTTSWVEPLLIRHTWEIPEVRTRGVSWCDPQQAIGKDATLTYGRVHCYLGNGNYLDTTLPQGGDTQATFVEKMAVSRPKCRTETRWHDGRWEKHMRKGWVAA